MLHTFTAIDPRPIVTDKVLLLNSGVCPNIVTYWPSTEPSIKKQLHPVEYHLDLWTWLNSVQMRTPTGSRWMSNNYITRCHRRLESVGVRGRQTVSSGQFEAVSSSQLEFKLQFQSGIRCRSENQLQTEGLGPQNPDWAAQQNEEEVLLWSEELGVNMWQSVPVSNSPLTHNQHQPFRNPFENKVREVYFYKEVCSFVCYCWLCFHLYLYMYTYSCMWLYNNIYS